MPKKRVLSPKSIWDYNQVQQTFVEAGIKESHLQRLYTALVQDPYVDLSTIPMMPKKAKSILDENYVRLTSRCKSFKQSADGETTKLLIELQDGLKVEAVIMTYDTSKRDASGQTGGKRHTLCVSSEVGCQMGCTFCATGTMGLTADLTSGEIIEQLVHARMRSPIPRNIVFMGMGEPMNNYEQVKTAISLMVHPNAFALRQKSVTLSTVGVIPRIIQLASDLPGISLALSLHAPNQELRQRIVPSARAYKLEKLIAAIDKYQEITKKRVLMEYVLLGPDFNCKSEHAEELGQLLHGKDVVLNIIPWNPILSPGFSYEAPPQATIQKFIEILDKKYRIPCTTRQEKGQDVDAACGQLVLNDGGKATCARDLEDLVV
ncbi:Ribosomal RNA large subunit methyltransferase N [Picochlorum sp. SENEW3]|nr:Ribosomal RNA large subunit methyltransferase N [Picochlorum sp. SENEW3]